LFAYIVVSGPATVIHERTYHMKPTSVTDLSITHVFDAPRTAVWQAWTDPDRYSCWYGAKGYTTPYCTIDLRPGGKLLACMRSPEGQDVWSTGVYREIVAPERIVSTDAFADEKGNVVPASNYGMDVEWPENALLTVTLRERNGQTELTLKHSNIPAGVVAELTETGWKESLDRLEHCLA
jgi:uncharacterized protein YndB with AHSA1/START domain